jgi:parallel beta-helix repeat protein
VVAPTWFERGLVGTRSLAARFGDMLSAKDFGAVGDGTTNDTAAIQAAIDAGAGKSVFFPPGTYRLSKVLVSAGDARALVGVPGQTILKTLSSDIADVQILEVTNVADVTVDGLVFDGNASAITNFQNVVQLYNAQRIRFSRCAFQNTRGIALLLSTNIQNCVIEGNRFLNCGYTGGITGANRRQAIAFVGATVGGADSYGNRVLDNTFENTGLDCISWISQNYGAVSGNRMNVMGAAGIYCSSSRHSVISGNVVRSGPGAGDPYVTGIDIPNSANIAVTGNIVHECSADGIGIYAGTSNCTVSGNTCLNNDQDGTVVKRGGIYVHGSGHTITGNVCADTQATKTQDYGLLVNTAATNVVIDESNNCFGNGIAQIGYVGSDMSLVTSTATIGRLPATNSGTAIVLTATGPQTNLDVTLTPKGTGVVRAPSFVAPSFVGPLTGTATSATTLAAGADRTKLDGISGGATVNSTDAALRDRATHTGSQAIGTVTGLQTALDAKAPLASPSFTGTTNAVIVQAASSLELGSVSGVGNTPFIDFHAGATVTDYDCRIIATAGTGTVGQGTLTYSAGNHAFAGKVAMTLTNAIDDAAAAAAGVALGALYRNGSAVMIRTV